jgi:D-alanyl-D-alanine carboxypeptidase
MKKRLLPLLNILICAVFVSVAAVTARFLPVFKPSEVAEPDCADYNHDWAFFLINSENPLSEDYEPELERIRGADGRFYVDARCAAYAAEMLEAAELDGINLRVVSAFRTRQVQYENFNNYVERLIRERNYSMSKAVEVTSMHIAPPGASEHNAGLAIDIISEDWFIYNDDYTRDFDQTPEFRWLSENSWRFGFILRYPDGKEDITGFIYEPWHYRFIGHEKAELIFNSGLTLEEFIEQY